MGLTSCFRNAKQLDEDDLAKIRALADTYKKEDDLSERDAVLKAIDHTIDNELSDYQAIYQAITEKGGTVPTVDELRDKYLPGEPAAAADITTMSVDDFDALLEQATPTPVDAHENVVPEEEQDKQPPRKPKEKTEYTQADAMALVKEHGYNKKKWHRVGVMVLRPMMKAIESKAKTKGDMIDALIEWDKAVKLQNLPKPVPRVMFRVGQYSSPDSSLRTYINWDSSYAARDAATSSPSIEPSNEMMSMQKKIIDENIVTIAKHYKGSAVKKANTYEGEKTEKGIHFKRFDDFAAFIEHYTGRKPEDGEFNIDTSPVVYEKIAVEQEAAPEPTPEPATPIQYQEGDKVLFVHPDTGKELPGTIAAIEEDVVDDTLIHYVEFTDPDGLTDEIAILDQADIKPAGKETTSEVKKKREKTAAKIAGEAAKHGVKGADEALTGLTELFGGKSRFSSGFTFDEDTYEKAKPHFKKALEEFVSAGKSLAEFVKFIVDNFGEGVKPYLKQFHVDVKDANIKIRGIHKDAESTDTTTQAAGDTGTEPGAKGATRNESEGAGSVPGQSDREAGEGRSQSKGGAGVSAGRTDADGKPGTLDLFEQTGEFTAGRDNAGTTDGTRGTQDGADRAQTDAAASERIAADAREDQKRLKAKPTTAEFIPADIDNIAATLPQLFPEQQEDVLFAEQRFHEGDGRGVLFTNGTGTGKTFTGLGVVKRFALQGKTDIIITVPGEKVAADWVESGKALGLDITQLKDTKDAGIGIVVTTYANFGQNDAIIQRPWDLVVHDEAHKLSENEAGNTTLPLDASRAITGHQWGRSRYAEAMEPELMAKLQEAQAEYEAARVAANDNDQHRGREADAEQKLKDLRKEWDAKYNEHVDNRRAAWDAKQTRRLDLSATPFAYVKNVEHAEGFLFEYQDGDVRINNSNQSGRELFFVEHFGYRIRYHKLTQPDADVDTGLMERQFNTWLKEQGALRGRRLEVDKDYSREFILIQDAIGRNIDEGFEFIREQSHGEDNPLEEGYRALMEKLNERFDYHARIQLLEAIKARHAVARAKKHIAMGRKVVIFHSRIKGGTIHPFHFDKIPGSPEPGSPMDLYNKAVDDFRSKKPHLVNMDINQTRPLDLFEQEFGDNLALYNGRISKADKRGNPDRFNADDGEIQVIAVQDEGGKEGISLHDTTGQNQRVLINLGLPVKPTQAIQIEGRIYRVGQMSDAIFEYFSTDTNFERWTFAQKISERASTAENLALGEEARALKDAFIDAYENAAENDPSMEQGKGGKKGDAGNWELITPYERAKTHYFGTHKNTKRRGDREGVDYFPTPEPLGLKMVEWAALKPNESGLEPSAGHGAIARYFPESSSNTFIEPSGELISKLALRAPGKQLQQTFEDLHVSNKFHAIVMNPPYGKGGATAMQHIEKAMGHLKDGGRIVALIPEGPAADKKFDALMYGKDGELEALKAKRKQLRKEGKTTIAVQKRIDQLEKFYVRAEFGMPQVLFERAGTSVKAKVVVIDRIDDMEAAEDAAGGRVRSRARIDIPGDKINEFFDSLEYQDVPERAEIPRTAEERMADYGLTIEKVGDTAWQIGGKTFAHKKPIGKVARADGRDGYFDGAAKAWVMSGNNPVNDIIDAIENPEPEAPAVEEGGSSPGEPAINFDLAQTTHAKKGIDLFVASIADRVPREKYLELKAIAKDHGGYYSTYKGKGAVPGFQFESAEDRQAFIDEVNGGELKADMRNFDAAAPGVDRATVEKVTDDFLKGLNLHENIEVKIYDDWQDLTRSLRVDPKQARRALGYIQGSTLHIIAGNLQASSEIAPLLRHEILAHYGLDGLDKSDKVKVLKKVTASRYIPFVKQYWGEVSKTYGDKYKNRPLKIAEEVFARIAEEDPANPPKVWEQIVDLVIKGLRKVGLLQNTMTRTEAKSLLKAIAKGISQGNPKSDEIKAMVAWHGSPHDHDGFSTAHIGTGEGAQAYGWGLYFASRKDVAKWYRDNLAGARVYVDGKRVLTTKGQSIPTQKIGKALFPNDKDKANAAESAIMEWRIANYSWDGAMEGVESLNVFFRDRALEVFDEVKRRVSVNTKGKLYQVELAPEENEYLLWDKPLSEQSSKIKKVLKQYVADNKGSMVAEMMQPFEQGSTTGDGLYRAVMRDRSRTEPDRFIGSKEKQKMASEYLHSLGIRGIKYLDGSSRSRPLRQIKAAFLEALPENADFDEVMELVGTSQFTPEQEAVLTALEANDWLGFDYPAQAISTALGRDLVSYDTTQDLRDAVEALSSGATYNYVIFNDEDVSISGKFNKRPYNDKYESETDTKSEKGTGSSNEPGRASSRVKTTYERATSRTDEQALAHFERARSKERVAFVHRSFGVKTSFNDDRLGGNTNTVTAHFGHFLSAADVGNPVKYGNHVSVAEFQLNKPLEVTKEEFESWGDMTPNEIKNMRQAMMAAGHDGLLITDLNWAVVFEGKNLELVDDGGDAWIENYLNDDEGSFNLRPEDKLDNKVEALEKELSAIPGVKTVFLHVTFGGNLNLSSIIIDDGKRKRGIGTKVMERITDFADESGLKIVLTPAQRDDYQGTTSHSRLVKFYKRFGFIENKGRNKDYRISESMYRRPEKNEGMFNLRPEDEDPVLASAKRKAGLGASLSWSSRIKRHVNDLWSKVTEERQALLDSFRQGTMDRFHGIKLATQRNMGNLPTEQDPYVTARLASGISSVMRAVLLHGQPQWAENGQHLVKKPDTKGLLEILEPVADNLDDFIQWMVGNRAARLFREGKENNFTEEEIAALQSLGKGHPEFREVAREFAAFKRSILDVAEGAGLIDPEARKVWDHADWIPFYRQMEENDDVLGPRGAGKSLANKSSGIRQLKGGESALNDPLENIIMNFHRLLDSSLKNNAVAKAIDAAPDVVEKANYEFEQKPVPQSEVKRKLKESGMPEDMLDMLPSGIFKGLGQMWTIKPPADKDVIRVMRNGKAHYYRVTDPLLLRAVTSFANFDFAGLGAARAFKRVLTAAVTATPEFILRNFIRDTASAAIIARNPVAASGAFKGIVKAYKESGGAEHMLFAGASFASGYVDGTDPEAAARAVRRSLRKRGLDAAAADDFMGTTLDGAVTMWEKYRHVSESVENANREAVFESTLGNTGDVTAAAYEAKDLMDFSLRGDWPAYQLLADVIPFFNARVQGLYRLGRTDPKQLAIRGGILLMLPTVISALSNLDNDDYEELPDWDKDTYWHFWLDGQHYRVPKPFEVGVIFATIPERAVHAMFGEDDMKKFGKRLYWNMAEQMNLIQMPQIIKPAVEVAINYNTFGDRAIETMSDERKSPRLRYNSRTSATMRELIGLMGPVADEIGLSPKKAQHLIEGYLGTFGAWGLAMADYGARALADDPARPTLRPDSMPIVKVLYRGSKDTPAYSTQYITDVYDAAREYSTILNDYKAMMLEGHGEEAAKILAKHEDRLMVLSPMAAAAKGISKLNVKLDHIVTDKKLTPEQKRKEIDQVLRRRNRLASDSVADAKKVESGQ